MFPSLLVTDGSCMIDRRMGIHGHPLEIQVSYSFSYGTDKLKPDSLAHRYCSVSNFTGVVLLSPPMLP